MPRINHARIRIEEVVVDEHLVPGGDKVHIDIVGNLQIAVHAEEATERAVGGIVKGHCIEGYAPLVA